jgi:toxin ParE1/3/4
MRLPTTSRTIAPATPRASSSVLTQRFEALGRKPRIGRARPELRPDLRSFPYGAYLILCRVIDEGVEIVRIVHAARNLDDLV